MQAYLRCPDVAVVLAFDGDTVVGASSCIPMRDEGDAFRQPFEAYADSRDAGSSIANQAQLRLFPEYAAMELCSLLDEPLQNDLHRQLYAMQALLPLYLDTYKQLAQQYQLTLVAGSFLEQVSLAGKTVFVNLNYVLHPDGRSDF